MLYKLIRRTTASIVVQPMFSETRTGDAEHLQRPLCNQWKERFELAHGAISPRQYKWLSAIAQPGQTFTAY